VDNSADTTNKSILYSPDSNEYAVEDTADKIFLLSCRDLMNVDYGFSSLYDSAVAARKKSSTDYAKSQGVWDGYWLSRSPSYTNKLNNGINVVYVNNTGSLKQLNTDYTYYGIAPALTLSFVYRTTATSPHEASSPLIDNFVDNDSDGTISTGDTFTFGSYPQTIVDGYYLEETKALEDGFYAYIGDDEFLLALDADGNILLYDTATDELTYTLKYDTDYNITLYDVSGEKAFTTKNDTDGNIILYDADGNVVDKDISVYIYYQDSTYSWSRDETIWSDDSTDSTIKTLLSYEGDNLPTEGEESNAAGWTSYNFENEGYCTTGSNSVTKNSFMWYIDVDIDGDGANDYRGVYFVNYRSETTNGRNYSTGEDGRSTQYNNGFAKGSVYWFKFEPITWTVLSVTDGKALVVSDTVLDAMQFYYGGYNASLTEKTSGGKTTVRVRTYTEDGTTYAVYDNNYRYSDIRAWLNGSSLNDSDTKVTMNSFDDYSFWNMAFSEYEQALILNTSVESEAELATPTVSSEGNLENNPYYNTDCTYTTSDKIFLLSLEEVTSSEYGFLTSAGETDSQRKKLLSGYASCMGAKYNVRTEVVEKGNVVYEDGSYISGSEIYCEYPELEKDADVWFLRTPSSTGTTALDSHGKYVHCAEEGTTEDAGGNEYRAEVYATNNGVVPAMTVDISTLSATNSSSSSEESTATCEFYVANYTDEKTSEVAIGYDVVVILSEDIPSGVSLVLDDGSITATKGTVTKTVNGTETTFFTYTFTSAGALAAGEKVSNKHLLRFVIDYYEVASAPLSAISVQIEVITGQLD